MAGLFPEADDGSQVTLEGVLERVTFANEQSAWSVVKLALPGRPELVTAVGNLLGIQPGETLRLTGRWVTDKKYGHQFQVDSYVTVQPATLSGIEKYLGSGLVRGIGPVMAKRLVEHFGMATLEVIEAEPARLAEVEGIGPVRSARIRDAWREQRGVKEVMIFLQSQGISTGYAIKIYKHYGERAIGLVKEDPYRLAAEIHGIGFRTADKIAAQLGIPPDSPRRARAGVVHLLGEQAAAGHVYFPRRRLVEAAVDLLGVEAAIASAAIEELAREGRIVIEAGAGSTVAEEAGRGRDSMAAPVASGASGSDPAATEEAAPRRAGGTHGQEGERAQGEGPRPQGEGDAVFLASLHAAEVGVAECLRALMEADAGPIAIDVERAIAWFEGRESLRLAAAQREAIARAVSAKALIITGGPGTGKTTLLNGIIQILERKGRRIRLAAPTGRAAKRLEEATGRRASTIHRLLEFNPRQGQFQRNEHNRLDADLVIVDEVSMLDIALANAVLKALPEPCQLILVGDVDQIPSVGPGCVLRDLIRSERLETVRLTEIFRQAESSRIVLNAHRINAGEMPLTDPEGREADFFFVERTEPEEILAVVRTLVAERIPRRFGLDPIDGIQVLTPMHRGLLGASNLNGELQALLNPGGDTLSRGHRSFRPGDKVMQIRNNYDLEVFNGDIGRIDRIDNIDRVVRVRFDDRAVDYDYADLDELVLAYACSIHKAQGSEYPCVVLPLHTQHYVMLQRNLLYTALTRARRLFVLVGSRRALAVAVRNAHVEPRFTRLAERLQGLIARADRGEV